MFKVGDIVEHVRSDGVQRELNGSIGVVLEYDDDVYGGIVKLNWITCADWGIAAQNRRNHPECDGKVDGVRDIRLVVKGTQDAHSD